MMDTLPIEVWSFLLKSQLTIDELLICRCVSKKFRYLIDNLIIVQSFCVYEHYLPINKIWFSTADQFVLARGTLHQAMQLHRPDELKLCFLLSTATLARLKSLYISTSFCLSPRLVASLNQLVALERLRINLLIEERSDLVLSLPALKILDCWLGSKRENRENALILVCPQLDRLRIRYGDTFGHLEIVHPETVVYLECPRLDRKIKRFINLEILFCQFIKEDAIEDDFLSSLSKLKELHFDSKDAFDKLARLRPQPDRPALYLLGVRLERLPSYELHSMSHILWPDRARLLFSNYTNIAQRLLFVRQLHYEPLKDRPVPADFAGRLVNLNHFLVCDTHNVPHLIELLARLRNIINLTFQFTNFGQNIFNTIPVHCPYVLCLRINSSDHQTNSLNFEFLFRFRFLHEFHTNHQFNRNSVDLIQRLFKRLNFFCSFNGANGGKHFEINFISETKQFVLKSGLHSQQFRTLPETLAMLFSSSLDSCSVA